METRNLALLTDLYEVTMAASYFSPGLDDVATYELFVRELPPQRKFLVVAGLDQALDYLEGLRFEPGDIDYLRSLDLFQEPFLQRLAGLRFTGEVAALHEGEVTFALEPLLRVTASRIEAQLVETFLLNCLNFQTMVASKAARVAIACAGRPFVDFSGRRDHGPDAAIGAARASYIGGAAATSNLEAGRRYGIPVSGTMAHSYVMSFPDEAAAFRAYSRDFPAGATLLIDTYDTGEGARTAARVASELAPEGIRIGAVRIDSGDLAANARQVRTILDAAGHQGIEIFASGDLDEYRIAALLAADAPIDGFGVGTRLGTSEDAPSVGGVYKLVEDSTGPRRKASAGKATLPGRKQVYRLSRAGKSTRDLMALETEPAPRGARPLLTPVMSAGRRLAPPVPLATLRDRCTTAVSALPTHLRTLEGAPDPYPVQLSPALQRLMSHPPLFRSRGRRGS